MLQMATDTLHFLIIMLFGAAITICALIYFGRGSKTFGLFGAYFVVQLVLEMIVHTGESRSKMALWINELLSTTVMIKGLFYGVLVFLMILILLSVLELPVAVKYFVPPGIIVVWLLFLPMVQNSTMWSYWLYLLPCEIYYFGLAVMGLRKLKEKPEQAFHPLFRRMLRLLQLFSVIIVVEDTVTCWSYGFFTEFSLANPRIGAAYVKERSFSESGLQMILAGVAIYVGSRILIGALSTESTAEAALPPERAAESADAFASAIGLSARERELLPLLLENLSMREISERLFISHGTVKSHTHNIYQKAGVSDRASLIYAAKQYDQK